MKKKKIAITMGDPGGVGPEIIVKALASDRVRDRIIPVVVGNRQVLEEAAQTTGVTIQFQSELSGSDFPGVNPTIVEIEGPAHFKKNVPSAEGGEISVRCIKKTIRLCMDKEIDAMVTAPISKEAVHRAGYLWPGHTELLAEETKSASVGMMFCGEALNVILVTIHASLRSAIDMISAGKVLETAALAERACRMLSVDSPRIAVAGLNPHAGEGGLFGDEEKQHIIPAIAEARSRGLDIQGPFPPDVVFKKALDGDFDMVIAMYHDQGLIPFKLLYFDTGVNVTVGIPIIRTSPDHGTAYDIAWRGIADPSSMVEAILLAARLKL
jgi:4-hydroxythreonine-4-phosphate dehydrogenase